MRAMSRVQLVLVVLAATLAATPGGATTSPAEVTKTVCAPSGSCTTLRAVRDAGGQNWHQFFSQSAFGCSPTLPVVCADGRAEMSFSSGCPGEAPPSPICLQLTGSASSTALLFAGSMSASLDHMQGGTCTWGLAGSGCTKVFVDPDTGDAVHKHWHSQTNTWQVHCGRADAITSDGIWRATGYFGAGYRYGPLGGGFPSCAP